ncbi:hypothetical protein HMP0721_0698 [Pseudoramibacter alactolyticus ATCC 23263]|uniref:EpsG family protein n=2 Tax=Pseudoramibacter TaxID=113286 RepID=E6MFB5_9FIRM|nr:hypothetical protein HMP0721_0698 [Pseudoramibacter alactolyticus ATCC 23263]
MIYLFCFALSFGICWIGEKQLKKKNKIRGGMILLLAAVLSAVLAALRDDTIGTDIHYYGNPQFFWCLQNHDLKWLIQSQIKTVEPLYVLLNFLITRVTANPHWLYFVISLLINGLFMAGLYAYRDEISLPMGWLCFLCLFYGDSLNLMRQYIAMGFLFWGFHFFLEKRYWPYGLTFAAAVLFHYTAVIGVALPVLYLIFKRWERIWVKVAIVGVVALAMIFYKPLLAHALAWGMLPPKYQLYLSDVFKMATIKSNLMICIFWLPGIILSLHKRDAFLTFDDARGPSEGSFYIFLLVLEVVIFQLRLIVFFLYRISLYFGMYKSVAYARLIRISEGKEKIVWTLLLGLLLLTIWGFRTVYLKENQIYPYTSQMMRQFIVNLRHW